MTIRRLVVIVAVFGVFLASTVHAQGFKWWQSDKFKTDLSLMPDQVNRLETTFQDLLPRMTAEKKELDRLETMLSQTIAAGTATEADVMKEADVVEAARNALGRTRTLMFYRMHRILTPEQRVKMNALHDKWEAERRQGRRRD
jgi:Spy/CpxP family protein refolding chaperone